MNWKFKSAVQNTIALLPGDMSYELYYRIQRKFGALRPGKDSPIPRMHAGVEIWERVLSSGKPAIDKIFFEVGTGRVPVIPLANFLMGARKTITVDLNPYLKEELCFELLDFVCQNKQEIEDIFGDYLVKKNLDKLMGYYSEKRFKLQDFLQICNIEYLAPLDATETSLEDKSIDYYISYTVFEHIPEGVLERLVIEGNRLLTEDGLHIHRIDYSDHFSHSDETISAINFLQFSDAVWNKYAGNRYMYMNRLRHDDFEALFESSGCKIMSELRNVDEKVVKMLENNSLQLDAQFANKSNEILSVTASWFVLGKL